MLKRAFSKLKLEHVVIGKGKFHQERAKPEAEFLEVYTPFTSVFSIIFCLSLPGLFGGLQFHHVPLS